MIKYKLKCKSTYCLEKNDFDGWFQNIEAYEKQMKSGLINCPICGSENVIKSLSTPNVKNTKEKNNLEVLNPNKSYLGNEKPKNLSILLRTIKKEIEKNSTYVGDEFVSSARLMKEGKIKQQMIHGHGSKKEIEDLHDEGIDVFNIPWVSDDH